MYCLSRHCLLLWMLCLLILSNLAMVEQSFAHRLRVFAYTSGAEVVVEASFGDKRPITSGRVTVSRLPGSQALVEGLTDQQGMFRFARPQIATDESLKVVVAAGQGHQAQWVLTPEDLGSPAGPVQTPTKISRLDTARSSSPTPAITSENLVALVEQAVAREIAPLKKMFAEQLTSGPSVTEIIGGIGWIVGLAGLLIALKKKKQ